MPSRDIEHIQGSPYMNHLRRRYDGTSMIILDVDAIIWCRGKFIAQEIKSSPVGQLTQENAIVLRHLDRCYRTSKRYRGFHYIQYDRRHEIETEKEDKRGHKIIKLDPNTTFCLDNRRDITIEQLDKFHTYHKDIPKRWYENFFDTDWHAVLKNW